MTTIRRVFVYDASSGETYQMGGGVARSRLVGAPVGTCKGMPSEISGSRGFLKSNPSGARARVFDSFSTGKD